MGQWTITIEGHGIHDNGKNEDADVLAKEFVDKLESYGHQVHHASFTVGSRRIASWDSEGPGTPKSGETKWVHGLV